MGFAVDVLEPSSNEYTNDGKPGTLINTVERGKMDNLISRQDVYLEDELPVDGIASATVE